MEVLKTVLELAASTYNTTVLNLLLLVSIVIFLEIMFVVLIGYVAIILGYKSNQKKMVKTLVIGFALYMITQIVTLGAIFVFGLFNPNVMNLINTTDIVNIDAIKSVMYMGIGVYVMYIIFYYILSHFARFVNTFSQNILKYFCAGVSWPEKSPSILLKFLISFNIVLYDTVFIINHLSFFVFVH